MATLSRYPPYSMYRAFSGSHTDIKLVLPSFFHLIEKPLKCRLNNKSYFPAIQYILSGTNAAAAFMNFSFLNRLCSQNTAHS